MENGETHNRVTRTSGSICLRLMVLIVPSLNKAWPCIRKWPDLLGNCGRGYVLSLLLKMTENVLGTLGAHKDKDKDLSLSGIFLMTWPSRKPQVGGAASDSTFRDVANNGALSSSPVSLWAQCEELWSPAFAYTPGPCLCIALCSLPPPTFRVCSGN